MLPVSQKKIKPTGSAYDRILFTASDLFYQQGYRATGINEVIEKAGVAKATFYSHFSTKDDLCLAYLKNRNGKELAEIEDYISTKARPVDRFLAVIESLEPWIIGNGMKGCGFLNMVPEVPDAGSPLRKEGELHYARLRTRVKELAGELIKSKPKRYGHLHAQTLADDYMVVLTGAIALAEISHDIWPIKQGVEAVRRLIH